MEPTLDVVNADAKRMWEKLQTLRDEVRVKLHLAGMDARDEWDRLELLLPDMEKEMETTAGDLSKATRTTLRKSVDDVIRRLEKIRTSLKA
jgi:hypothetical protein